MSLDPGVVPVLEAPERSVVVWYTIDSGVADANETAVRQPRATVRFAQVSQLQIDGAPATNAFGMPAYRLVAGSVVWEYEVPLARLTAALVAADADAVQRILALAGMGLTAEEIVQTTATEGYPEVALRRQIDVIETERRAGTLEVLSLRMVHGSAAPIST